MPPKPLSSFTPVNRSSFVLDGDGFAKVPDLAPIVMSVISIGSLTEAVWAETLVALLKSEVHVGVSMYQGIISAEAKRGALIGAAKAALSNDDVTLFEAVLKVSKGARDMRNKFAHHLWGCTEHAPGCLLLVNPKHWLQYQADLAKFEFEAAAGQKVSLPLPPLERVMVYDRVTLQECVSAMNVANWLAINLLTVIRKTRSADAARQQLLSHPGIQ